MKAKLFFLGRVPVLWLFLLSFTLASLIYLEWPNKEFYLSFCNFWLQFLVLGLSVLLLSLQKWVYRLLAFLLLFLLMGSQLIEGWNEHLWTGMRIAGHLSFTDPSGYLQGADNVTQGYPLNPYSSTRPIAHSFLASVLFFCRHNIEAVHLAYATLHAFTLAMACFVIRKHLSYFSSFIFALCYFSFSQDYIGSHMSENYGFMLGTFALLFLLQAESFGRRSDFFVCALLMSIALLSRAGAFFILPFIALFICFFPEKEKKWKVESFSLFLLGILLAVFLHLLLIYLVGDPDAESFSNFVYSLHGLIHGETWKTAFESGKSSSILWDEIFLRIATDPFVLIECVLRAWKSYYIGLVEWEFLKMPSWLMRVFQLTTLVTLFYNWRFWGKLKLRWALAFMLGLIISIPMLPPWDAGIRPYAATLAFQIYLSVAGFYYLESYFRQKIVKLPPRIIKLPYITGLNLLVFLLLFTLIIPVCLRYFSAKDGTERYLDSSRVLLNEGSYLRIDSTKANSDRNVCSKDTFLKNIYYYTLSFPFESKCLQLIPENAIVTNNFRTNSVYILRDRLLEGQDTKISSSFEHIEKASLHLYVEKSHPDFERLCESLQQLKDMREVLPWFDGFDLRLFPWVVHEDLGWFWVTEKSDYSEGFWMKSKDEEFGYLFTAPSMFPVFARDSKKSKVQYDVSSRQLIDLDTMKAIPLPKQK